MHETFSCEEELGSGQVGALGSQKRSHAWSSGIRHGARTPEAPVGKHEPVPVPTAAGPVRRCTGKSRSCRGGFQQVTAWTRGFPAATSWWR